MKIMKRGKSSDGASRGIQSGEEGDDMLSAYVSWVGQAVILRVVTEDLQRPLRGVIVGESEGTAPVPHWRGL